MKTEYLQVGFLILFAYLGWKTQPTMARHSHHHHHTQCYHCPPGFGVHHRCTRHQDTECRPCAPDHYSSHRSANRPCYPCSRCGLGLYVAHHCSATNDTVCDSCHTYKGPHNDDFYERCVKPLLLESREAGEQARNRSSPVMGAERADPVVASDRSIHSALLVAGAVVVSALAVTLAVTWFVSSNKRHCKRVNCRYPYEAVAMQEAVML